MAEVEIANAFVANYVEVRGSLAYIMGAFPEWWSVPALPSRQVLGFVVVAQLEDHELAKRMELEIAITDPDGKTDPLTKFAFVRGTGGAEVPAPKWQTVPTSLSIEFRMEGEHRISVSSEGNVLASVPLGLRFNPPPSLDITDSSPPPSGVN